MYFAWIIIKRPAPLSARPTTPPETTPVEPPQKPGILRRVWRRVAYSDAVDIRTVDLRRDEHEEEPEDVADDLEREVHLKGRWGPLWKVYYAIV